MKRLFTALLLLTLLIPMIPVAFANEPDIIKVKFDGTYLDFDVNPILENDRVLVPFRRVMEVFGLDIQWADNAQKITASDMKTTISLTIGEKTAYVNGGAVALDAAPRIVENRTLIPLRFISEMMGAEVEWNGEIATVFINTYPPRFPVYELRKDGQFYISYIDKAGKVVIPFTQGSEQLRVAEDGQVQLGFSAGFAEISTNNGYVYLTIDGEVLTENEYNQQLKEKGLEKKFCNQTKAEFYLSHNNGLACCPNREQRPFYYEYKDWNGESVFQIDFEYAKRFSEGMAVAKEFSGNVVFMNSMGEYNIFLSSFGIQEAEPFSEGLAAVNRDGKLGFINKSGEIVISPKFDDTIQWVNDNYGNIGLFNEGVCAVRQNGKYGFINRQGDFVIPPVYDGISSFSEGMAAVCMDGKWGYIDHTGTVVIECKYMSADDFNNGLTKVYEYSSDNIYYLDAMGNIVAKSIIIG